MESVYYLTASLFYKVAAILHVELQVSVRVIHNTDGLVDEQIWEHVLHSEGHIQDVRHLRRKKRRVNNLNNKNMLSMNIQQVWATTFSEGRSDLVELKHLSVHPHKHGKESLDIILPMRKGKMRCFILFYFFVDINSKILHQSKVQIPTASDMICVLLVEPTCR